MTRQPGHLNGSNNKNFQGSNENWRTGSTCVGFSTNHRYHKYKNLIRGFVPTRPNELWVSDITYIDLVDDCCYLHLVTDAYSHKIVGWCLSETLEAEHTLEALRMAVSQVTADELKGLIHHSDRGVQYCCYTYDGYIEDKECHAFLCGISSAQEYIIND